MNWLDKLCRPPMVPWNLLRLARLAEGIGAARTVTACWKTGLVEELRRGPRTFAELMDKLELPRESLRVVLDGALRFGLVRRRRKQVAARSIMQPFWRGAGSPLLAVSAYCASNLGGGEALIDRLRMDRRLAGGFYESLGRTDSGSLSEYGEYMAITAAGPSATLARSWPLADARHVLDVGGNLGHFSAALCARNPDLRATVADLPGVQSVAGGQFGRGPLARVGFEPVDFRKEDFPSGHDGILFARVLHDWDGETVRLLLDKARRALRPGGQIAIFEVMRVRKLGNPLPVVLNQWEVLMSSVGKARNAKTYRALLERAGFGDVRVRRPFCMTGWNTLITARC